MSILRIKLLEIIDNFKFVGDSEADILDAVVCILQSEKLKDEWISVTDRVPKNDDQVFTIDQYGCVEIYYYDSKVWEGWHITHWQPLPTPPPLNYDR